MRLNLYDKDLNRIRFIDENFISCLWAENYNSSGKFTIELPLTEENKKNVIYLNFDSLKNKKY